MKIEVGTIITPSSIKDNVTIKTKYGKGELYIETVVYPGFSDAHAHPQVVDVGKPRRWKNSYEWLKYRRLRVDETKVRKDSFLSSKLARATYILSLLEGATLIVVTGNIEANLNAAKSLGVHPRIVLTPTIMEKDGWLSIKEFIQYFFKNYALWNGYWSPGIFVHSLGLTSPNIIREAYYVAEKLGVPLALHLSEGITEVDKLTRILNTSKANVIAVHCISEPKECFKITRGIVHCPSSNLYLFEETVKEIDYISALGSDWPLVTGGIYSTYKMAVDIHGPNLNLLRKASYGGYKLFGVKWYGDFIGFDEPLEKVISGKAKLPCYVFVKEKPIVIERSIKNLGLNYEEAKRIVRESVKEALEKYPI